MKWWHRFWRRLLDPYWDIYEAAYPTTSETDPRRLSTEHIRGRCKGTPVQPGPVPSEGRNYRYDSPLFCR